MTYSLRGLATLGRGRRIHHRRSRVRVGSTGRCVWHDRFSFVRWDSVESDLRAWPGSVGYASSRSCVVVAIQMDGKGPNTRLLAGMTGVLRLFALGNVCLALGLAAISYYWSNLACARPYDGRTTIVAAASSRIRVPRLAA